MTTDDVVEDGAQENGPYVGLHIDLMRSCNLSAGRWTGWLQDLR